MGVRDEILMMLKVEGLSPAEITRRHGTSFTTIIGYLDQMVGDGRLRLSDIVFSVPTELRNAIVKARAQGKIKQADIIEYLQSDTNKYDDRDFQAFFRYGGTRLLGELYEDVRTIEVRLHRLIKKILQKEYGKEEPDWWGEGIPQNIREECARRKERDKNYSQHAYCYTDLIDMRIILDKESVLSQR